ncbi:hypothetical protein MML48_1g13450 [Holotrichia oblita]|uniref:Uncharacterized protein n=1 Tax=Holotrichia oblita TaxID=644536 RepID=A0ACB9TTS4_HOLOL|nr:hypothetical protein MML48_1g13450 [Holotrichia oblita]
MDSDEEILEQFLESESDSEKLFTSSEDDTILMLGCALSKDSRIAIKSFVEEVVPKYSDIEFLSHFRIRRTIFQNLCDRFKSSSFFSDKDAHTYPCSQYLLTPYKDNGYLTANQKKFNKQLSSCRVFVEHTIGILKQRFRQLYHLKTRNISLLLHQIKACCVLHNLASEDELQYFEEREIDEEADDENEEDNTLNDSKNTGKLLRDLLSSTL